MNIRDCYWELKNLGVTVAEIEIENTDVFDLDSIVNVEDQYQYIVVKVPMGKPEFNFNLMRLGYTMIETQLNISKKYKDFNFEDRLVRSVYPHATSQQISTQDELEEILSNITPDMYSTDRIYLDKRFSHECSSNRYKNWIRTEFENKTAIIKKSFYDDVNVGYSMARVCDNGTRIGLLGGIYEKYQTMGLGILTTGLSFISAHKEKEPFKMMKTAVSSNNPPVWQLYNYLGFKIDKMAYVFVKHID